MKPVSVIMATYNNEKDIELAANSILQQDFHDLELVIVNDASTDATPEILQNIARKDNRLVLLHNKDNLGRAKSRNRAVEASQGRYLAILDADDIAMPQRITRQYTYLQNHSDIGLLGSWAIRINNQNESFGLLTSPTEDATIRKWFIHLRMPFLHSSVMMARELIYQAGLYDPRFSRSQDSHLLRRVIRHTKAASLPDYLILYRSTMELDPAKARQRYRWSAFAGWDSLKQAPNIMGIANLSRVFLMSCLPDALILRSSNLYKKNERPCEEQIQQIASWIERLAALPEKVY